MQRLVALMLLFAASLVFAAPPPQLVKSLRAGAKAPLHYWGFHVYDAQLFADRAQLEAATLFDGKLVLSVTYARALLGEKIAERSLDEIEHIGLGKASERTRWLAEMKRIFPNVAAKDTLTAAFEPGSGIRFWMNSQPLAEVKDPAFAQAFLSIWLSEKTSQPKLRAALLKTFDGK